MKVSRNKNIITMEVEPSDCPPGADIEFIADAIMTGMQTMMRHTEVLEPYWRSVIKAPGVEQDFEKSTGDLLERWEMDSQ